MMLSTKLRKGQLKSSVMLDCKDCMGLKVKEICLNKHAKKDIPKTTGSGSHSWNLDQMNDDTDVFYFKITQVLLFICLI